VEDAPLRVLTILYVDYELIVRNLPREQTDKLVPQNWIY
jgi:hypothetical protein